MILARVGARNGRDFRRENGAVRGELQREEIDRGKRWRTGSVRGVEDGKMDTEIRRESRGTEIRDAGCGRR